MTLRVVLASLKVQVEMTRRDIEDLLPLLTMPLFTLVFMSVLVHAGRRDLNGYAIVAPLLITVAQMGIFVASEMITRERWSQTLELVVATPAPFSLIVFTRIAVLTSLGLLGFVESWLLARVVFNAEVTLYHPWVLVATLIVTILASSSTALITSALICFARSTRSFQNIVAYPLFLISGVLVPVSFLPDWLEPLSRAVFLFWSANLLRDAMAEAPVEDIAARLGAIVGLGAIAAVIGFSLIHRMLLHLKREGTLGLS